VGAEVVGRNAHLTARDVSNPCALLAPLADTRRFRTVAVLLLLKAFARLGTMAHIDSCRPLRSAGPGSIQCTRRHRPRFRIRSANITTYSTIAPTVSQSCGNNMARKPGSKGRARRKTRGRRATQTAPTAPPASVANLARALSAL